ncbi:MAG: Copper amine oxidase N-terminal domain [Clostridia bacterium]|jgi:hypothetical protein|nr:Copper amine oxidase N-terminal domain [Clostridia bacterium]
MKKFLSLIIAAILCFVGLPILAKTVSKVASPKVIIDGKEIKLEATPFIDKGELYVPASVAKNFDAIVTTNYEKCDIARKDIIIRFWYSKSGSGIQINWQKIYTKPLAIRRPNMTFIPLKFTAQTLNCEVSYNQTTNAYTIINNGLIKVPLTEERYNDIKGYVYFADGTPAKDMTVYFVPSTADGAVAGEYYYRKFNLPEIQPVKTNENGEYVFPKIDTEKYPFFIASVNENANGSLGDWYGQTPCEVDPELLNNVKEAKGYPSLRLNSKRLIVPTFYIIENPFN